MKRLNLFLSFVLLLGIYVVSSNAQYTATMTNWKNHPDVKEVRAIYEDIKNRIKKNEYTTRTRRFNVESSLCSTYPVKSQVLVLDTQERPRLYQIEQIGSHREPFRVERYYDAKGMLRFVFVDRPIENVRIYLNREGNVIWAVTQSGEKLTVFDSRNEDWETKPSTANKAKDEFDGQQLCPEISR